jgi:hypothetical protein
MEYSSVLIAIASVLIISSIIGTAIMALRYYYKLNELEAQIIKHKTKIHALKEFLERTPLRVMTVNGGDPDKLEILQLENKIEILEMRRTFIIGKIPFLSFLRQK